MRLDLSKQRDILRNTIYFNCIKKGDFTLSSGIKSNTFIDLQEYMSLNPVMFNLTCLVLKSKINKNIFDAILGVPYGGNLYAIPMSLMMLKPFVYMKKFELGEKPLGERYKNFRKRNYILIEDVTTTGNSAQKIIDFMYQLDNTCQAIYCIVKRRDIDEYFVRDIPTFTVFEYTKEGELI